MVEHATENRGVDSSILSLAIALMWLQLGVSHKLHAVVFAQGVTQGVTAKRLFGNP